MAAAAVTAAAKAAKAAKATKAGLAGKAPGTPAPPGSEAARRTAGLPARTPHGGADPGLLEELKAWRRATAQAEGVPAFRVLTNATLDALATLQPRDREELLAVPGMGPRLADRYGGELLAEIAR